MITDPSFMPPPVLQTSFIPPRRATERARESEYLSESERVSEMESQNANGKIRLRGKGHTVHPTVNYAPLIKCQLVRRFEFEALCGPGGLVFKAHRLLYHLT